MARSLLNHFKTLLEEDLMNKEKMDQLLEELATKLYNIPPVEWNRIILYSEVTEISCSIAYFFYPTIDNEPRQSYSLYKEFRQMPEIDETHVDELYKIVKELRVAFNEIEHSPWNVITVIVEYTGDYQVEFDLQDFAASNSMDRRVVWKEKYLVDPPLKQEMDPQKKMDNLINNLAQNLVSILHYNDGIPVDWHRVEFYAEVGEEKNSIHYLYYPESDKQPRTMDRLIEENRVHPFDIKNHTEKLGRVVGHLLNAFTEFGNEPWTTIRASIDENGKFGVKFGYEDLSESTEEQRVEQWKASLK